MELENKSAYPEVCHRILDDLSKKLPDHLTYHCLDHTIDVANVCNHYIEYYMVADRVANLMRIAAVAHDYGYIFSPKDHEERSIQEVRPMLKDYKAEEISLIEGMIRATKVPQQPQNMYEEMIADADLDYLGRDDYTKLASGLYKEFMHYGVIKNDSDWLEVQIKFLEKHQFHTDWAKMNRTDRKQQVLQTLRDQASKADQPSRKAS